MEPMNYALTWAVVKYTSLSCPLFIGIQEVSISIQRIIYKCF